MLINQRDSAIAVYHLIEANGSLCKSKLRVLRVISYHGPLTSNQISQHLFSGNQNVSPGAFKNTHARVNELEAQGTIMELGVVACPTNGHMVTLWEVTGDMPRPYHKEIKASKNQIIDALCALLERAQAGIIAQGAAPKRWEGWHLDAETLLQQCKTYRKKPAKTND